MTRAILGSGWKFPVRINGRGGFSLSPEERDVAESIWIVLATARGERIMRPEPWLRHHDYVFAPNNAGYRGVAHQVQQALIRWEPRIDVIDVRADDDPGQPSLLLMSVDYQFEPITLLIISSIHFLARRPRGLIDPLENRSMPLTPPNLDNRNFEDLFKEARSRIPRYVPEWTDWNENAIPASRCCSCRPGWPIRSSTGSTSSISHYIKVSATDRRQASAGAAGLGRPDVHPERERAPVDVLIPRRADRRRLVTRVGAAGLLPDGPRLPCD